MIEPSRFQRSDDRGQAHRSWQRAVSCLLCIAYPRWFLDEFGAELRQHLALQRGDARYGERALGGVRFWWDAGSDALLTGALLRLSRLSERLSDLWHGRRNGTVRDGGPGSRRGGMGPMLEAILRDVRHATRTLIRSPRYALFFVITLGLGIGANTALFSVLQAAFFAQYPIRNPDELLRLYGEERGRDLSGLNLSVPKFEFVRDQQQVFTGLAAANFSAFTLIEGSEAPVQLTGAYATANFLPTFGATPIHGRFFEQSEEKGAPMVVLSETLWRARYGADPAVLGRGLNLSGVSYTIIGIAPRLPGFWQAEVWVTRPFEPANVTPELIQRGVSFLWTVGRMKPGVTAALAHQELSVINERYRSAYPDKVDSSWNLVPVAMRDDIVGSARSPLLILLAAVGLVLLIACANVANLVLVRFAGQRRQVAVRTALGASRARVVQQFVIENLLMSGLACMLGLVLATVSLPVLIRLAQNFITFSGDIQINLLVLGASIVVSLITGLLIGVYPALLAARVEPETVLREGGRGTAGGPVQQRARNVLVAGQVALALLLIAAAALLTSSFLRLQSQPPGFRADGVLTAELTLPAARYPDIDAQWRFYHRLLEDMRSTSGVVAASLIQGLPLSNRISRAPYARADGDVAPVQERPLGPTRSITPGYFATLEIPLLAGRDFMDRDLAAAPQVVIISRATARRLFPDVDAVGRRILMGTNDGVGLSMEVVGVVEDVRSQSLAQVSDVEFYRPVMQRQSAFMQLTVRTRTDPLALSATVGQVLERIDAQLPLSNLRVLSAVVGQSLGQQRLLFTLLALFGGLALTLAAVGIYSVVTYSVATRSSEIGVRMALGETPRNVLLMVIRQAMKPVFIGGAIGLACCFALGNVIERQLYGVSATDPVLLATTCVGLVVVAVFASWLPARRATRVDPIVALRFQ